MIKNDILAFFPFMEAPTRNCDLNPSHIIGFSCPGNNEAQLLVNGVIAEVDTMSNLSVVS